MAIDRRLQFGDLLLPDRARGSKLFLGDETPDLRNRFIGLRLGRFCIKPFDHVSAMLPVYTPRLYAVRLYLPLTDCLDTGFMEPRGVESV